MTEAKLIRQACDAGGGLDAVHIRAQAALNRRLTFDDLLLISGILERKQPE